MKLNPDCIRDILLLVEQETSLSNFLDIEPHKLPEFLSDYQPDEVMYHIKQCELSDLLFVNSWYLDGSCLIKYLTPNGHKFLSDVRDDSNWRRTKECAKKVGSNSLDALKQIASALITSLIQSQFGLS